MTEPERPSRVWLLLGAKAGDNDQLEAIAAALEELRPVTVARRVLRFHRGELLVTLLQTPSLLGLVPSARTGIEPPWPQLVLTAGRRNEPVARWIQRRSGGRTRLVHVGRPWADPRRYDLVISTAQYFLDAWTPGRILCLDLPPVLPSAAAPGAAEAVPSSFMALLVGGESGSQTLPAAAADTLCRRALALARSRGLALRVSTSARTIVDAERALQRLAETHEDLTVHGWHAAAAAREASNPYREWLRTAAAFVVTGDSVSMVTDAVGTNRPVWIARLPRAKSWWRTLRGWRWRSLTHELAQQLAPRRFRRDVGRLLAALVRSGRAQWLEDVEGTESERAVPRDELRGNELPGDAGGAGGASGAMHPARPTAGPRTLPHAPAAGPAGTPGPTPALRAAQAVSALLPAARSTDGRTPGRSVNGAPDPAAVSASRATR